MPDRPARTQPDTTTVCVTFTRDDVRAIAAAKGYRGRIDERTAQQLALSWLDGLVARGLAGTRAMGHTAR